MKVFGRDVCMTLLLVAPVLAKTLRYQIVTRDDGKKEILNESEAPPSHDIQFLARDLNLSFPDPTTEAHAEEVSSKTAVSDEKGMPEQFLKKWNSYTANGWTGQKNQVYANSTKLAILKDDKSTVENQTIAPVHVKRGRSENLTETSTESTDLKIPIDQPGMWNVIERLYDCFHDFEKHGTSLQCLKSRVTTMFLKFIDHSFAMTSEERSEQKTLLHGKKLLKGALLPLLVLLIIKYLVALPVIAAGLITIKTFWLSLLSAGVAAFGAPWKGGHVVKRYRPLPDQEQSWSHPQPAWTNGLQSQEILAKIGTGTEKYYM